MEAFIYINNLLPETWEKSINVTKCKQIKCCIPSEFWQRTMLYHLQISSLHKSKCLFCQSGAKFQNCLPFWSWVEWGIRVSLSFGRGDPTCSLWNSSQGIHSPLWLGYPQGTPSLHKSKNILLSVRRFMPTHDQIMYCLIQNQPDASNAFTCKESGMSHRHTSRFLLFLY